MADHPVKVPPELFTEWLSEALLDHDAKSGTIAAMMADRAAQWGADQELDACCQSLYNRFASPVHQAQFLAQELRDWLRAARRPKRLTPAEKALVQYDRFVDMVKDSGCVCVDCVRDALKRLAELEAKE